MASAVSGVGGSVVSIGTDSEADAAFGRELLRRAGLDSLHALIHENSNRALPKLHLTGKKFDFIYTDGWKTFDHLAFEVYLFNQILNMNGVIVFDDPTCLRCGGRLIS